jgi:integrase
VIRDALFWLPLLALFTGARLEELGQLLVRDVQSQDGIDYLAITTIGGRKSLKNLASVRRVPIHPELVKIGFLDFVKKQREEGQEELFPELERSKQGSKTKAFSQWINRYLGAVGITSETKVFHCFRHTWKDAARAARMQEEHQDALVGHSGDGKIGRGYGSRGVPLEVLSAAMATIEHPVALRHLL